MCTERIAMSLADLMWAVPCLALACISNESPGLVEGCAGCDLKTLRLLCKDMEKTMAKYIRSCSIDLGDNCSLSRCNLQAIVRVTRFSRLSTLRVVVPQPQSGSSTVACATRVARQVADVIAALAVCLRTITRLELDVQDVRSNASRMASYQFDDLDDFVSTLTEVLEPLAVASPAVQQVHISGSIGRSVIASLGISCKQLTALELGGCDVPIASLERLHLLLPRVTHLKLLPSRRVYSRYEERQPKYDWHDVYQKYANLVLDACHDCPSLTDLDAPWVHEGQHPLPSQLQRACLATAEFRGRSFDPSEHIRRNTELQVLKLHDNLGHTRATQVARVLEESPLLTSLQVVLPTLSSRPHTCVADVASCVIAIQERCKQGLAFSARNSAGIPLGLCVGLGAAYTYQGETISTDDPRVVSAESDLEPRLQQLSSFQVTMFSKVWVTDVFPGHSFQLLPKIFPQITSLLFSQCTFGPSDLLRLTSLSSLEHMEFCDCVDLTVTALTGLCLQLATLKFLTITACFGLREEEAQVLRQHLGQALTVDHAN